MDEEQETIEESAARPVTGKPEEKVTPISEKIQGLGQVEPDPDAKGQAKKRLLAAVTKEQPKKRMKNNNRS